jgi:hypothetical protein
MMRAAMAERCHDHGPMGPVTRQMFGFLMGLVLSLSVGCGPNRPATFEVSGMVTLDGQPVPVGDIVFCPDAAQGNSGMQTRAAIRNGAYRTPSGKGHVGGPMVIVVNCLDGIPVPESPDGCALLDSPFKLKRELPRQNETLDIAIPGSTKRATR